MVDISRLLGDEVKNIGAGIVSAEGREVEVVLQSGEDGVVAIDRAVVCPF